MTLPSGGRTLAGELDPASSSVTAAVTCGDARSAGIRYHTRGPAWMIGFGSPVGFSVVQ
jgi:hypothetical protein